MGFSQADFQELQINLNKIRFGPRQYRPPPIQLSILPKIEGPKRPLPKQLRKPSPEPGYERFQLRLW